MRAMVFYRDHSEHGSRVTEFLRDFTKQTAKSVEVVDPDSRSGSDLARLYDIVEYPTIIATTNDGQLLASWRGLPLPSINEVNYYVQ